MARATRVQKLRERVANAAQDTPEEAEIAQRMLANTPEGELDAIASNIMLAAKRGIDEEFLIGRLLNEAAAILDPQARTLSGRWGKGENGSKGTGAGRVASESPYGDWFRAQNFPFSMQTARRLRNAAERESEVRAFIAAHTGNRDINVNTAMTRLTAGPTLIDQHIGQTEPRNHIYVALRSLHGKVIGTDAEGNPTNAFIGMHAGDLADCKQLLQELVTAWTEGKQKVKVAS